jgi:uncharacterized protein (TIGR03084 family)
VSTGSPSLAEILVDLTAEHGDLDSHVAQCAPADWNRPTPAVGWSVRDTISHLAFFDEQATTAATHPDQFRAGLERVWADPQGFIDAGPASGRAVSTAAVLDWWRAARAGSLAAFHSLDPSARIPWYGPDMGPVSFASARLMETWAHGQDVVDALGVRRVPTARLRHIAHIGVRTMGFSFVANDRPVPEQPVHVELIAPDGSMWVWGPTDAVDRVTGTALGFCLLVTQRRHIDDLDVTGHGPVATEWLSIAQAFAGPAGSGRQPGMPAA